MLWRQGPWLDERRWPRIRWWPTNTNVVAAMGSHVVVVTDSEWQRATTSDRVALTVSEVCTLRNSDVEVVPNSDQAAETITDRAIAIGSVAVCSDVVAA